MRSSLIVLLLLTLVGCMHTEPEQKENPIMVLAMDESQDPQGQKYIVNQEIVSSLNYPGIFQRKGSQYE